MEKSTECLYNSIVISMVNVPIRQSFSSTSSDVYCQDFPCCVHRVEASTFPPQSIFKDEGQHRQVCFFCFSAENYYGNRNSCLDVTPDQYNLTLFQSKVKGYFFPFFHKCSCFHFLLHSYQTPHSLLLQLDWLFKPILGELQNMIIAK